MQDTKNTAQSVWKTGFVNFEIIWRGGVVAGFFGRYVTSVVSTLWKSMAFSAAHFSLPVTLCGVGSVVQNLA